MDKKIVIFFWIVFLLSLFFHHHQSVKKEILFSHHLSSRYERVVILNDERWDFSWKDQILNFIVIFILFSFLITVITKKYNDHTYYLDLDEEGTIRFLTRLFYKNISPFEIEVAQKNDSLERYKILNGGGRKRNLFGTSERCFFIEYVIYFQLFYNFLFFLLDSLIFPMIRAFFRKKKEENLMDCVDHIIMNKFYFSEDGLESICMFFVSPMAVYILYRFLAFLVIRIYCVFDETLAEKMLTMANEEGKKIRLEIASEIAKMNEESKKELRQKSVVKKEQPK